MSYKEIASKTAVIITVYNREDLVKNAVGSIVNQTLRPGGIIVVDDASKDKSGQAAVEAGDGLVTLVTLPVNMGAGIAKRAGFQKAKEMGFEFVMCLDSDDILDERAIQAATSNMEKTNADMVTFGVIERFVDKNGREKQTSMGSNKDIILTDVKDKLSSVTNGLMCVFANARLMRIDVVMNPEYSCLRKGEDTESTIWWNLNSKKISIMKDRLYIYNRHQNSITLSTRGKINPIELIPFIQLYELAKMMRSGKVLESLLYTMTHFVEKIDNDEMSPYDMFIVNIFKEKFKEVQSILNVNWINSFRKSK